MVEAPKANVTVKVGMAERSERATQAWQGVSSTHAAS